MSTDLEKPVTPSLGSKEAPIEGVVEEGNVVEAGDNQLLGAFPCIKCAESRRIITNQHGRSPAWLQARIEASIFDRRNFCHRLQYHGLAPLYRVDSVVFDSSWARGHGLGMSLVRLEEI